MAQSIMPTALQTLKPRRLRYADRKPGRPTLYKPDYCQTVESLGKKGYSPAQLADFFNIDKSTLLGWAGVYPEFATALSRAKTFEQAEWERTGKKALNRKHFQANVWRTSMSARFKDDYTEGRDINVSVTLESLVGQSYEAPKTIVQRGTAQDVDDTSEKGLPVKRE